MSGHYKDLITGPKAMELVNAVYDATEAFPKVEIYSLTNQLRRAPGPYPATSQRGRRTTAIVNSSTFRAILADHSRNWETQILIAQRRNYLSGGKTAEILKQADELNRIRSGSINSLKRETTKRD
jgi:four helix bundle protein